MIVILGAGIEGLVAALLLAQAGHPVTLLERRASCGGLCAREEFFPPFYHFGILDGEPIDPEVARLAGVDARPDGALLVAKRGGKGIRLEPAQLGPVAEGVARYRAAIDRFRPLVRELFDADAPGIGGHAPIWPLAKSAWRVRGFGPEVFRVPALSADEWLSEFVSDPAVRAALCAPALVGTWMGPRSPWSAAALLVRGSLASPAPRASDVVDRLLEKVRAAGVVVRTLTRATRIEIEARGVVAVHVAGGERIAANAVVSAVDPRTTLLQLADARWVPPEVSRDVADVRCRGTLARVHLALSAPLPWTEDGSAAVPCEVHVGDDPLDLERAFDDVKFRRLPRRPWFRARTEPQGSGWVAALTLHCASHALDEGWSDAARETLCEQVLRVLEEVAPGAREKVLGRQVLTPADLESIYGLTGGHAWHGEVAVDQLWALRPTAHLARYETPIPGLFLASRGTHPGLVLGSSGRRAALAMLRHRG